MDYNNVIVIINLQHQRQRNKNIRYARKKSRKIKQSSKMDKIIINSVDSQKMKCHKSDIYTQN